MNRIEKIMFRNREAGIDYAIPDNFEELKALINAGFCVMNIDDITESDYINYFEEWDDAPHDLYELSLSDLRELFQDTINPWSDSLIELALIE